MIWKFLNEGENSGGFNMKRDLDIAGNISPDETVLRLYRWKPYCISLGANQIKNEIDFKKTDEAGIDVVKRPTGGRAILHAEELTYAVIMPLSEGSSARNIYRDINLALLEGLKKFDIRLAEAGLEENQPDFPEIYRKESKSTLCFAVSAKNELKFGGKKLVGSAQRKLGRVILQHGSALSCGIRPSSALVRAAACLRMPNACTTSRGMRSRSPPMAKNLRLRAVWAPQ